MHIDVLVWRRPTEDFDVERLLEYYQQPHRITLNQVQQFLELVPYTPTAFQELREASGFTRKEMISALSTLCYAKGVYSFRKHRFKGWKNPE